MSRSRRSLGLKCATAAVAVALLTASTVQAAAASTRPVTHDGPAAELSSVQTQPMGSGTSYFWTDVALTGGVLAGVVVLGLWGDVVVAGMILGIQLLCAGVVLAARATKRSAREPQRGVATVEAARAVSNSSHAGATAAPR